MKIDPYDFGFETEIPAYAPRLFLIGALTLAGGFLFAAGVLFCATML